LVQCIVANRFLNRTSFRNDAAYLTKNKFLTFEAMKNVFFILFLCLSHQKLTAQVNIIPQPVEMEHVRPEIFLLDSSINIYSNDTAKTKKSENFLRAYLTKNYKLNLPSTKRAVGYISKHRRITLKIFEKDTLKNESYRLWVNDDEIRIWAKTDTGLFYGIQTLIQLLPTQKADSLIIPAVNIVDYPRFAYRGMHLDVSRHFFEADFVKQYIDYLALHKMNYFHWHLTDDHGWRIAIKKYPKLTDIGAYRNGTIIGLFPGKGNDGLRYGGYYTQEQIKEVVKYASDRYITIIPEIEMPAHSLAVLAAYPELGTQPNKKYQVAQTWGIFNRQNNVLQPTEKTFTFLQDVLSEVMELFPSPYIHIGGDEASKIWWKQSPVAQQIIKKNKLKDETALQSYFMQRIGKFVNSKGKTIIGWDEILDGGTAPNTIVMSWRGEKGGISAAKANHKVIMTPEEKLYFNHSQFVKDDSLTAAKYLPLKTVYDYEPIPLGLTATQASYIWGAQGNLWTEYIANPAKVNYMLFPRLDALSEILWSPKEKRNYPDFLNRLNEQFKRYDLMGIGYSERYLTPTPLN
jgi:hexosaminidase